MNFLLREKEMGANSMDINLNMYQTLAAAVAVFFLGGFLKTKIKFLRKYCIPAPSSAVRFFHHQLHSVH